jgi:hypothetical protein
MTAREVLADVLARSTLENSARGSMKETIERATSLATLTTRYQHAWSLAAHQALTAAAEPLSTDLREKVIHGQGASYLAQVLAEAAAEGADTRRLLSDAIALDDLGQAISPALVIATRILDQRRLLGVPTDSRAKGPLPWLPPPEVGHPGWLPYLRERAGLIARRAKELGSLVAAYREQYGVDGQCKSLGDPPRPGTRREIAYRYALRQDHDSAPTSPPASSPRPRSQLDRSGPQLTR